MKILTKKWAEKHNQVRFIHALKQFNAQKMTQENVILESKNNFYNNIEKDFESIKRFHKTEVIEKLFKTKINKNKELILSLPKSISDKITDINTLIFGYANKEDKKLLTSYAKDILNIIEKDAERANILTEIAEDYLPEEFTLDKLVGELAYQEYSNSKDYFFNIGGLTICIENYQIIEREKFKINLWEENNPLTLWTTLYAGELYYISNNRYELHLLFIDGDKYANETYWYFTLSGTNIKFIKNDI